MTVIKTHEELMNLHGRKVTCTIGGRKVLHAKICVEDNAVYICQNIKDGTSPYDLLGYMYGWVISRNCLYEDDDHDCTNIKLVDTTPDTEATPDTDHIPRVKVDADNEWEKFAKCTADIERHACTLTTKQLQAYVKKLKEIK